MLTKRLNVNLLYKLYFNERTSISTFRSLSSMQSNSNFSNGFRPMMLQSSFPSPLFWNCSPPRPTRHFAWENARSYATSNRRTSRQRPPPPPRPVDPYTLLGVPKTATDKEIRQRYLKLAREGHPDLNPGDPNAAAKFAQLNTAYEQIKDETKRREHHWNTVTSEENESGFQGRQEYEEEEEDEETTRARLKEDEELIKQYAKLSPEALFKEMHGFVFQKVRFHWEDFNQALSRNNNGRVIFYLEMYLPFIMKFGLRTILMLIMYFFFPFFFKLYISYHILKWGLMIAISGPSKFLASILQYLKRRLL